MSNNAEWTSSFGTLDHTSLGDHASPINHALSTATLSSAQWAPFIIPVLLSFAVCFAHLPEAFVHGIDWRLSASLYWSPAIRGSARRVASTVHTLFWALFVLFDGDIHLYSCASLLQLITNRPGCLLFSFGRYCSEFCWKRFCCKLLLAQLHWAGSLWSYSVHEVLPTVYCMEIHGALSNCVRHHKMISSDFIRRSMRLKISAGVHNHVLLECYIKVLDACTHFQILWRHCVRTRFAERPLLKY